MQQRQGREGTGALAEPHPVVDERGEVEAVERLAFRAREWWLAGSRSTEPAQHEALDRLDLTPLVDYRMRLGEGTGALAALPLLHAAGATLREMATFDEAGVSDREG